MMNTTEIEMVAKTTKWEMKFGIIGNGGKNEQR